MSFISKMFVNDNPVDQMDSNAQGYLDAIDRVQAVIEFDLDGTIRHANANFLAATGYALEEIQGNHHSMFVEDQYARSREYREFWAALNRGEFMTGEYKRFGKEGNEIWIAASYNPILDLEGRPTGVVKFASDITEQKLRNAEVAGQLDAINRSQAVIEFQTDGTIINANENFLGAMGYSLNEIQGKHHRMFVDAEFAASGEYAEFWDDLKKGKFASGEFPRVAKGGRDIWIQATYNPILDSSGRVTKVVKFASDITEQKQLQKKIESVLGEVTNAMDLLAKGSLAHRMRDDQGGEFKGLVDSVNSSLSNLSKMVGEINEVALMVDGGASEISDGNNNLSHRTEAQAANLEQAAHSIDEISNSAKRNAESASDANSLAIETLNQAKNGGSVVQDAVNAMEQINQASTKISAIIGVIDEIAFQTNLLALNASVEAARAGEHGRGFGVVATEVRNLAGRSATAAKEIKELIKDSGEKVTSGSALVNQSGETLDDIVQSTQKLADIVGEIATATVDQSGSIEKVNVSVRDMEGMTQQNAALVEEAAAASESLSGEARRLKSLVGTFQIQSTM
ncbi:MAG: methyl-accepting chemotaxis protein [Pseudomonadota bacterium]